MGLSIALSASLAWPALWEVLHLTSPVRWGRFNCSDLGLQRAGARGVPLDGAQTLWTGGVAPVARVLA